MSRAGLPATLFCLAFATTSLRAQPPATQPATTQQVPPGTPRPESTSATTRPAPMSTAERPAATQPAATTVPAGLPAHWLGHWSGPAELLAAGRPPRPFRMELHIAPIANSERYTWTIVYGEGEQRQERPYELMVRDAARGQFAVDEGNSIVLPLALLGDAFYSAFEIEGATLHTVERLIDPGTPDARIEVEIVAYSGETTNTGGQDGTPEVKARVPGTVQRATLRRQ